MATLASLVKELDLLGQTGTPVTSSQRLHWEHFLNTTLESYVPSVITATLILEEMVPCLLKNYEEWKETNMLIRSSEIDRKQ